jgi:hypothetical protein
MNSNLPASSRHLVSLSQIALAVAAAFSVPAAHAFKFDTGYPELKLRWDNTVKYSTAYRLKDPSAELINVLPKTVNQDDGDRNFKKGVISNRLDLLSEFDASYGGFGIRVSGAAWYDSIYRRASDHDSPFTYNALSRPFPDFPEETRKQHGQDAELLDAFLYGQFELGDESKLTFRAGKHALLWGESLFFGGNGIAGGMAPVDVAKALSVPNTPFKELVRPVGQVSTQLQLRSNLAIGAYVQYDWQPLRLPGSGSYFSGSDAAPVGGETLALGPGFSVPRGSDVKARNSGQGGAKLRWRPEGMETDFGVYAIRYHDKGPQLFLGLAPVPFAPSGTLAPANFFYVYPEGISAYGVSATTTVGEFNLAAEVSYRKNAALVSSAGTFLPGVGELSSYARGDTLHVNFNWLAALGPSFVTKEATFIGEVAFNRVQKVTKNPGSVDPNTSRDGLAIRVSYEPTYRQVLPGLDLSVPVGVGYTPRGRSAAGGGFAPDKGGDMTLGLNGTYLDAWRFSLSYTHYYGPVDTFLDAANNLSFKQNLKDRDFIALSLRRTF